MKDGVVQNLTNETPEQFLERVKGEVKEEAKPKKGKKKFPKVSDEQAIVKKGSADEVDPNDLTKDDFTC